MKYKTIKISEELHIKIKKYCDEHGIKLNWWYERMLESCLEKDIKWWDKMRNKTQFEILHEMSNISNKTS